MDYYNACKILDLNTTFSSKDLKHNYYKLALKYHPDKNIIVGSTEKFQEILDAYIYLQKYSDLPNCDIDNQNNSYTNILEQFMSGIIGKNLEISKFLPILNNKCTKISIEFLKQLPKSTIIQLYKFTQEYTDVLTINQEVLTALNAIVTNHTTNNSTITLNPSLENLLNDEVYKLTFKNETYCVPLWHHELVFDLSNNLLVIDCDPILPEYINLDKYNNLYINISTSVSTLINQVNIDICIGDNTYVIPVKELYLRKFQRYTLKGNGVALINTKDIFNIKSRANIYVDIRFIDIE